MKCFGIKTVRIETAGSGNPQGEAEAELIGAVNALELRNEIISRRDHLVHGQSSLPTSSAGVDPGVIRKQPEKIAGMDIGEAGLTELREIKETLQRIEKKSQNLA